jgi:hypothetical protein
MEASFQWSEDVLATDYARRGIGFEFTSALTSPGSLAEDAITCRETGAWMSLTVSTINVTQRFSKSDFLSDNKV